MSGPGARWIGEEERREVLSVLESGHLSRYGREDDPRFLRKVLTLEREFASRVGVDHALGVNSGTSALLSCLLAMGLRPGDEVIVPAYTYVASYTAVLFAGGVPILVDVDESLTMDPEAVRAAIGPKTRFLLPVHMLGNPCDLDALGALAHEHGLAVLEDCAQAGGASFRGRPVGAHGAMGAFSFNVFKTITAGDGGLLVTDDRQLYERAFAVHDQGHTPLRAGVEVGQREILGMNFRMNELTGAVALAQLRKLDAILETLRRKKAAFRDAIGSLPRVRFRTIHDPAGECATLLVLIFDHAERAARAADALGTTTLERSGWHVYRNMEHVLRRLSELGRPVPDLPRTDDLLRRCVNLSVGVVDPGLGAGIGIHLDASDQEIEATAARVRRAVEAA
jgi:dTDP-4-amino-4,6-dideoxygalactose transaminase